MTTIFPNNLSRKEVINQLIDYEMDNLDSSNYDFRAIFQHGLRGFESCPDEELLEIYIQNFEESRHAI